MEDISEMVHELFISYFHMDTVKKKSIDDFKYMIENNNDYLNLIHPDYRNFDVLSIDQIAQIFYENGEKIKHILSSNKLQNYERLLCFKDETESKLISHLIDVKISVERLYEKFQDAVRMRADATEVKMLLRNIDKFQSDDDEDIFSDICEKCSSAISVGCYFDILSWDHWIIISEKQLLDSEVLVETAKILLQGNDKINNPCSNGQTPLLSVAYKTNIKLGLFLIENGAHVNIVNNYQPLYLAVQDDQNILLIEKMIEKGANLDTLNGGFRNKYDTALHKACTYENENALELLIRKGANITLKDSDGKTPFATLIDNISRERAHLKILFIKEIAKAEFENRKVAPEDLEIIRKDPKLNNLFEKCSDQLDKLKNTIFYPPFSYIDVLNMRNKNVRKLVKLLKNENFMRNLAANLSLYSLYNKDLMINFVEAEIIRRKYDKLESILKFTIGKHVSTDLIMYIVDFIGVQDLSLFADRESLEGSLLM